MDICLQVFINAPAHELPADKAARRFVNGDIFGAIDAAELGDRVGDTYTMRDEIGTKVYGFIFVTDTPLVDIEAVNDVLTNDAFNSDPQYTPEGWDEELQEIIPPQQILDNVKRNWAINLDALDISNKHTTIDFVTFNALCHDKLNPDKTLADMGVI